MTAGVPERPVQRSFMDRMLDGVERVGNKVPHPVLMFAYLILFIIIASTILGWLGVSITDEIAVPVKVPVELNTYEDLSTPTIVAPNIVESIHYEIQQTTIAIRPLLTSRVSGSSLRRWSRTSRASARSPSR